MIARSHNTIYVDYQINLSSIVTAILFTISAIFSPKIFGYIYRNKVIPNLLSLYYLFYKILYNFKIVDIFFSNKNNFFIYKIGHNKSVNYLKISHLIVF